MLAAAGGCGSAWPLGGYFSNNHDATIMKNHKVVLNIPRRPIFPKNSPALVRVLDKVRKAFDDDEYGEFYWFAREYPRIYHYHLNHAQYRLELIYKRYEHFHSVVLQKIGSGEIEEGSFGFAESADFAYRIYWDFEAYLSAINTAIDVLARIVGTAYKEQLPPSFNKVCRKNNLGGLVSILQQAKEQWVSRLKDYRDCFVHYTPVDNLVFIQSELYSDGWEIRCKLPSNPNTRDMMRFKFSRRSELLRYSLSVWRHMQKLDKDVASYIFDEFNAGRYPQKIHGLFTTGMRSYTETAT